MPSTRSATRKQVQAVKPSPTATAVKKEDIPNKKITKASTISKKKKATSPPSIISQKKKAASPSVIVDKITPRSQETKISKTPATTTTSGLKRESSVFKTPVNEKRKKFTSTVVAGTMEGLDNFPERLNRYSRKGITVTSTPKPAKESLAITKKDVDTCFGFDASDEENYDSLISPIAKSRTSTMASSFNALLARYHQPEPDGLEVHFDPAAQIKTYAHKKVDHDFHPNALVHHLKSKAPRQKKGSRKDKNGESDEMKKWLEDKNKEFEQLLHVSLVVEQGKD